MSSYPGEDSGEQIGIIGSHRNVALRRMSAEQLLHLGRRQMVYLKAGLRDGELLFVLYGADGVPLATADAVETAVEMACDRGLAFVSVH